MKIIEWKQTGWTNIQEADAVKHVLEINCRTEDGMVVEVRVRHNDGEEVVSKVKLDENSALPMSTADFEKYFKKGKLVLE